MSRPDRGVLDTSALLALGTLDPVKLPREPLITAVTLAELAVGPLVTSDVRERAARQSHLQQAEASFDPLPFDAAAARAFGRVASSLRASGRKPAARSLDAMIASIAIAHGLALFTANARDFAGIAELDLRDVSRTG